MARELFMGIKASKNWTKIKKIEKGWSSDRKYYIEDQEGNKYLLRISDISRKADKEREFKIIKKLNELYFPMSIALDCGICDQEYYSYQIFSWVEGQDLEEVLPQLEEKEQYELGIEAGQILRVIHSIPLEEKDIPTSTKIPKKLRQLELYEHSLLRMDNDEGVLDFARNNLNRIWRIPPAYLHGDFHPGNLIYTPEGKIGVIDFNRLEVGDPYEEFYKLESFVTELSIPYCLGQLEGYFDGVIPMDFWETLAVYVAHSSLYSIKWAQPFGEKEIEDMRARYVRAYQDYNGYQNTIPSWFKPYNRMKN